MSDDDIEGILHEISEILGGQSANDSQCTDNELSDSRSVEEILKDAEDLVCSSATELEEKSISVANKSSVAVSDSNKSSFACKISKDKIKTSNNVSFAEDVKENTIVTNKLKKSKSFTDFEKTKILDDGIIPGPSDFTIQRPYFRNENKKFYKGIRKKNETYDLKLSDLATVYEDIDIPIQTQFSKAEDTTDMTDNDLKISSNKDIEDSKNVAFLEKKIDSLNLKIDDYQKKENEKNSSEDRLCDAERKRLALLEEEVLSQEELIASYQRENQRLCSDIINAKEAWKETEKMLVEKARQNEQQKISVMNKSNYEIMLLKEKLKTSEETISSLQMELKTVKEEKEDIAKINEELTVDVTRINCEIEEYKKEMEDWRKAKKEKLLAIETNATIQGKLSQANTEVTRKQTEIVRLNGMIGQLRGELEKIRLGSVINQSSENLSSTISQLQAALAIERENSKELTKEKETMSKEVLDLRRQVKEMENIMIKRSKSGSGLSFGEALYPDTKKESFELKHKALLADLSQSQSALAMKQQLLDDLQSKYDQDIFKLEQEVKKLRKESVLLKHSLEERDRGQKPIPAAKEDAHLLATIRGLKAEINNRDKDIVKLNRELDDVKKTNRRLQREREKALNAGNKFRSNGS